MIRMLEAKSRRIEPTQTIYVPQAAYAIGSAEIPSSRYLITSELSGCVAVLGYNRQERLAFLAHVEPSKYVDRVLSKAKFWGAREITLYGGSRDWVNKKLIGDLLRGTTATDGFTLLHQDLPTKDGPYISESRRVGIDSQTGEVFVPENGYDPKFYPGASEVRSSFGYESTIAIEEFLAKVRRK